MTKGCKIWLWFIFIINAIVFVLSLPLIFRAGLWGIYAEAAELFMIIGIALLLFKQKKTGFYIIAAVSVVCCIVNIISSARIIYPIVTAIISPAITYYFISKNSDVIK